MNMNVYLNDSVYHKLDRYLKANKISRSQLVSQALESYLTKEKNNNWPNDFFKFNSSHKDKFPDIKELREGLIEPDNLK